MNKASEWVKCSNFLPEKDQEVLCFLTGHLGKKIYVLQFYIYKYTESGTIKEMPMFKSIDRSFRLEDVTHWRELPKEPDDISQ